MNHTTQKFERPSPTLNRLIPLIVCVIIIAYVLSGERETDWQPLSGDEVRALFSGKTVKGYHEKARYSFTSYYEPTGIFRSYQGEAKEPRHGIWWVNSRGDICINWEDESHDLCRKIMIDSNMQYRKVLIKPNGKRILIVSFESFADGNPYDL